MPNWTRPLTALPNICSVVGSAPDTLPDVDIDDGQLAFVMYTSGTTGR